MSLMGELKFSLGFQVKKLKEGIFSCQTKYIKDMLQTYPLLKIYDEGKRMIDALADLKKLEIGADGRNRA